MVDVMVLLLLNSSFVEEVVILWVIESYCQHVPIWLAKELLSTVSDEAEGSRCS